MKEFIEGFDGPNGRAEVYEVVVKPEGGLGVEKVEYHIEFNGSTRSVMTMGEASVVACELSGNQRFLSPSV